MAKVHDGSVNDTSLGQLGSYHVIQTSTRPGYHLPGLVFQSAPSLHARCFLLHTFPSCYVNLQGTTESRSLSIIFYHLIIYAFLRIALVKYSQCLAGKLQKGTSSASTETLQRKPRKQCPSQLLLQQVIPPARRLYLVHALPITYYLYNLHMTRGPFSPGVQIRARTYQEDRCWTCQCVMAEHVPRLPERIMLYVYSCRYSLLSS